MNIQVGIVTQDRDIAAQTDFLNVPWQLLNDDGSVALEGVQAFPLTATEEDIRVFLSNKMTTYKENLALHEGAKDLQAAIDNGQEVADKVSNINISE